MIVALFKFHTSGKGVCSKYENTEGKKWTTTSILGAPKHLFVVKFDLRIICVAFLHTLRLS